MPAGYLQDDSLVMPLSSDPKYIYSTVQQPFSKPGATSQPLVGLAGSPPGQA
jgi:hypothetical protein